ncbi:uncharacterized protein FOMMEDRAFT_97432 [Fomitiporia mediterranea MF3/22]|uniref:uncharacterized protein n=1 Tax=Fomitiporia mediterranea (strain MF3/22) TaxID=694068 RepID=UPI000440811D|nr:uncharacterized protein FOMMEDRAFT_97432 [Fomitiporia mediterranea MF3/22]EJC97945.1 hypothetical protein FOMMEDRAFT_97432 [Fomitiporia mediterranea MF3/22]
MEDESKSLEALSETLTHISTNPYDLSLHAQHVQLALASGMGDQVTAARQMLTAYWPAGDEVWLPIIDLRISQGTDTVEDALEVLTLFQTAEEDYLSIPMLQKHIEFLLERHIYFHSLDPKAEELQETFSSEWTRMMAESVVKKASSHLTEGHLVWNAYFNWEMEQLDSPHVQSEERADLILRIEDILLERLKQPHSTHEETFQSYSTFTTNNKPADIYEKLLVSASKAKAPAIKAYQRRERNEQFLIQSDYSPEAYDYYLTYEHRARKIDLPVISMLYERAISDTAKRRFQGTENAEAALRVFWSGYCDVLRTNSESVDRQQSVLLRATRSVPGSGVIWARYIRFLESTNDDISSVLQATSEIYDKAFSTGLIQKDVEEVIPLVRARASLLRRADVANTLFRVLEEGIEMVRSASPQGDPRFRLEKYLADLYVELIESHELSSKLWESTAKHYKTSYLAWVQYTESLTKEEKYDEVRTVFKDIVTKRLDWPEVVFDAWINFEHLNGNLDEIYDCLDRVGKAQQQVNSRRAKEAQKAAYEAAQASTAQEASAQNEAPPATSTSTMDVDEPVSDSTRKRKVEDSAGRSDGNKKAKMGSTPPLKRDRENSTVFVADLPSGATEDDLTALFKDCGDIREIKITSLANSRVATIEFVDRESVPAGLTKDKKRINGQEISVHLAWQSTLYVTNFPEKVDDAYIRQLFDQFGVIFDVRWPSKKFKATRRFCYVQFTSKEAAQAALSLHGTELEPGLPMNVFISNPERKKERTDAGADDREVYVAGLSKFVIRDDLKKLFKTFGPVKDIRVTKDDTGLCKGVAFVEFEDEPSAQRALQANNHDVKNRRIAVTMSDSRVRARHKNEQTASGLGRRSDVRSRSVRIKGLPPGTQEGLLQQALEKVVPVKRLEVFQDLQEATAELESAADAGKLLLAKEPLQFNGVTLDIFEEPLEGSSKRSNAHQPTSGGSMFIPRNAASRPRAGLGSSKKSVRIPPSVPSSNEGKPSSASQPKAGRGQDDFRKLLG